MSVNLTLKHSDISTLTGTNLTNSANGFTSDGNTAGSWKRGRQSSTWRVSMENLLGNQYKIGRLYQLRLNIISTSAANFPLTVDDQSLIFKMSGLTWINCNYDPKQGNTNQCQFLTQTLGTNANTQVYGPSTCVSTFVLDGNQKELTISLFRLITNTAAQYGTQYFPMCVYSFSIHPIIDESEIV
jgi:hypothetical protein